MKRHITTTITLEVELDAEAELEYLHSYPDEPDERITDNLKVFFGNYDITKYLSRENIEIIEDQLWEALEAL